MTDHSQEQPSSFRVRPYTVTRGRTQAEVDLGIETMIQATGAAGGQLQSETRSLLELCAEPLSIAEISAHLQLPLQVVKVLAGDLVIDGQVATHGGSTQSDGRPDLALLERVLDGLQSL